MAHHGNSGGDDGLYRSRHLPPAFQLHAIDVAFLHQAAGVAHGFTYFSLIGHKGQIADQMGIDCPTRDGATMVKHFIHRHRNGALQAHYDHPQRITDKDDVDRRPINKERAGIVVGGQHGDQFAAPLFGL